MKQDALKAAVLISGTGSNLKALIDAVAAKNLELDIVRVVSNKAQAPGIVHAVNAGIPVSIVGHTEYPDRVAHDGAVVKILQESQAELVILAGYMRILGEDFTNRFNGRMINLHPSLLPLYKGLDTYNRVLKSGDKETGASIHFVTAGLDSGPVISQVRIPVLPDDNAKALQARLGPMEHQLLTATVSLFCKRELSYHENMVFYRGQKIKQPLLLEPDGITF